MIFEIHEELCINCGSCRRHCPFEAIPYDLQHRIDADHCTGCTLCYAVCPVEDCITPLPQEAEVFSDQKRDSLRRSLLQNNSYWARRTLSGEIKTRAGSSFQLLHERQDSQQ